MTREADLAFDLPPVSGDEPDEPFRLQPNASSIVLSTMPPLTLHPIEDDDPADRLRKLADGTRLRVYLTDPHPDSYDDARLLLEAKLCDVEDEGLVATWDREAERVTELLPWDSIRRVKARLRASRRGTKCAIVLMLTLGSCGGILDSFPGDTRSHFWIVGVAIGLVIGLLVAGTTSEWTVVYETPPQS